MFLPVVTSFYWEPDRPRHWEGPMVTPFPDPSSEGLGGETDWLGDFTGHDGKLYSHGSGSPLHCFLVPD